MHGVVDATRDLATITQRMPRAGGEHGHQGRERVAPDEEAGPPGLRWLAGGVEANAGIGDLQNLGSAIVAGIRHALDAEIARSGIALGISPKGQYPVERRTQLSVDLSEHISVAQVVLAVRLRIVCGVEPQALQAGPVRLQVDVCGWRVQYRPVFGEDVPECEYPGCSRSGPVLSTYLL